MGSVCREFDSCLGDLIRRSGFSIRLHCLQFEIFDTMYSLLTLLFRDFVFQSKNKIFEKQENLEIPH